MEQQHLLVLQEEEEEPLLLKVLYMLLPPANLPQHNVILLPHRQVAPVLQEEKEYSDSAE